MSETREPIDICNALAQWAEAANLNSPRAGTGSVAVVKSCLLSRLIYGGERGPSRTPCPVHQGRWSGIHFGWPGQEWLFADGRPNDPVAVEPRLQEAFDAGCRCFQHKGASDTTGWNPDEFCCADRLSEDSPTGPNP